jgi:DMSO/TMAO reductase YedYZ molybdopterin-dependent catalytic subunit
MVRRPRRSVAQRLHDGRSIGELFEEELAFARKGPLREGAFPSRLHDERTATLLGVALGISFLVCFLTGLVTQFAQHPLDLGFLSMPASPGWLYRLTQGMHVATGTLAVPLLLAKLWTVYPRLFTWPPIRNVAHAVERISLLPLVAGSIFQLGSGLANGAHWRPWLFNFPVVHYWMAWIVIGALVAHIGAKWTIARRSLGRAARQASQPAGSGLDRRGFLTVVAAAAGVVTLTTIGQTFRPLRRLALLAPRRPDAGPQGIPVNKSASGAGVLETAMDHGFRLVIEGRVARRLELSRAQLLALPQHSAHLAIACVEGWSSAAVWSGVPIRDLVELAGGDPERSTVVVHSLQQGSAYSSSQLNEPHVRDRDTLLALAVGGEPLHIDHGYPCRLIAPNRPGVQQTKWVTRMVVT